MQIIYIYIFRQACNRILLIGKTTWLGLNIPHRARKTQDFTENLACQPKQSSVRT